jgi:phytanoyl-CoA hydroxylase
MGGRRADFERDGYLVLPGFVPAEQCDVLRKRMAELLEAFEPAEVATIFSTRELSHAQDRYFLESGDKIRFFFEEEAFDPDGRLKQSKARSINKIGHALHDLDPVFAKVSRSPRIAALAAAVGPAHPLLLQSMYIFKQPHIGGEVGWHQDATFLYTQPVSVVGLWMALDDATIENGCMTALAGAHRGPLRRRFQSERGVMAMRVLDETPWPEDAEVAIEAPRGSVVVLHGLLPHASGPNLSARPRHAYSLHLIDATAEYPADNWLQRPDLPLRGFA